MEAGRIAPYDSLPSVRKEYLVMRSLSSVILGMLVVGLLADCSANMSSPSSSILGTADGKIQAPSEQLRTMRLSAPQIGQTQIAAAAAIGARKLHVDHGKSRMYNVRHDRSNQLLYVSDFMTWDVQVYNYPSNGKQKSPAGTLTGFTGPEGECVDKARHNVFITNEGESQIWEFAYGATSPTVELIDPNELPVGCSIDPATGNLAVTNIFDLASASGSVSLYVPPFKNGNTPSNNYSDSAIFFYYFLAYDTNGNLFVDGCGFAVHGCNFSGSFRLAELPKGSSTFTNLSISNAIKFPGGVNYDDRRDYVDVTDQIGQATYGYAVSGSAATLKQTTPMGLSNSDIVQSSLTPGLAGIIGPDAQNANADTYFYPAGGSPEPHRIITAELVEPIGSAILKP
jgi:hypothetical protein